MGATLSILRVVKFSSPENVVYAKGGTYHDSRVEGRG